MYIHYVHTLLGFILSKIMFKKNLHYFIFDWKFWATSLELSYNIKFSDK